MKCLMNVGLGLSGGGGGGGGTVRVESLEIVSVYSFKPYWILKTNSYKQLIPLAVVIL